MKHRLCGRVADLIETCSERPDCVRMSSSDWRCLQADHAGLLDINVDAHLLKRGLMGSFLGVTVSVLRSVPAGLIVAYRGSDEVGHLLSESMPHRGSITSCKNPRCVIFGVMTA